MALVPPEDAGLGHATLWLAALTLSWTVALTPYFAWGAEMSTDYAGRARVTAWREAVGLVGVVTAAILYDQFGGGDGRAGDGLEAIALLVAIALPIAVLAAVRLAPEPRDHTTTRPPFRKGLRAVFRNRPFLRLLAAYFVNGAANAPPAALFLFFAEHRLEAPAAAGGLLLIYFLAAIAGAPIWSWAARRWSKHRAWCVAMLFAATIFATVPLLGAGDVALFAVICVLTGLALGADLSLPPAMQADVVDLDTAASGEQRTGVYFGLWSVATKAALAFAGGAALIALDATGFTAEGENTPDALLSLALLYALAPALLKVGAIVLMWRFPLDATEQAATRRKIEAAS
jgi:Na+/melibiose symporter-like transporter